ncbi:MAG: GDYXXLXY domain-containing protein [Verrucomicrobiota bacterium]|jgi:uncharacterized membrane-anchored protein
MQLMLLILVLALQAAWLLGMVATQEYALTHGKAILLETQPVDPRDMLSGDYLMLRYKISDVPTNFFSPPVKKDLPFGTKIFVSLAPGTNEFYVVARASTNALAPSSDAEVVLAGKSTYAWWNTTNSIHVEYGIERYYVAEGTGNPPVLRSNTAEGGRGKLTARAVVPASGHAKLQQVFLEGKPYEQAMKNPTP